MLLTIKDGPAVLRGGGQGQAGVVKFVAVVANADLKLDGVIHILEHGGRVEGSEEGVLPTAQVLLQQAQNYVHRTDATTTLLHTDPPLPWHTPAQQGLQDGKVYFREE